MKRVFAIPLIASFLVGTVFVTLSTQGKAIEADAAVDSNYSSSPLPTTINLNPVSEANIRSYYSNLDGHSYQGNDLLKALKPILMNGQMYHNYDSGNDVWKMYEIADRDWTLSPATELNTVYSGAYGTYDAETNTITGYVYGDNSDGKSNPYIHTLYRNPGVEQGRQKIWNGDHGENGGIDQEHIWPKSRGFGKKGSTENTGPGARGDIHHLWPGDHPVNSYFHSNWSYGFVDPEKTDKNAGSNANYYRDGTAVLWGNLLGTSSTFGTSLGSGKVFEPQDCDKGDIARACFYMAARYNNIANNDDEINCGNPNLFLEDTVDTTTIYSDSETPVSLGLLRDLLAWHHLDPVDEFEIHRNDLVYRNFTNNRNPFIDFPEWADFIWGTSVYDDVAHKVTAYDSAPTGSANPASDTLHGYNDDAETWVKATDVRVGDEVSIVVENANPNGNTSYALSGFHTESYKYGEGETITIANDSFPYETAISFIVCAGNAQGTFALKTSSDKYLSWDSGTALFESDSLTDMSSWTITINNGTAAIVNYSDASRSIQWSNGSTRFASYAQSNLPVSLYKTASCAAANSWSDSFLNTWSAGCDPNGVSSTLQWNEAKAAYNALSSFARTKISEKEADSTTIGLAVERYDYIVGKYHLDDFLHRVALNSLMFDTVSVEERPNVTWIVVSFAASVALCVPGLCFALMGRKKKHE